MSMQSRRTAPARMLTGVAALACGLGLAITPVTAASASAGQTTAVVLQRSGGIAGITEWFIVDRSTAAGQAATVLDLAADQQFRSLRRQYLPADPCCDRFRYDMFVRYADGSLKEITTVDATPATPAVLTDVIRLTVDTGARTTR